MSGGGGEESICEYLLAISMAVRTIAFAKYKRNYSTHTKEDKEVPR